MISGEYYRIIYDIITFLGILYVLITYSTYTSFRAPHTEANRLSLFIAIFFSIFIGFRPISMEFVDMISYAGRYDFIPTSDLEYTWDTENKIFDNLILFFSLSGFPKEFFFFIITSIYYIVSFIAIKRIFKENTLAAYIIWLGSFSTFSYSVNGIKAGVAAALFLLALSYNEKKTKSIIFALLSLGFHHSMIVCIVTYIITLLVKNSKYYLAIWFFCLVISALHITFFQSLFGTMTDDYGKFYLTTTEGDKFGGRGGFRFDFVIYSAVPIFIGYLALFKKRLKSKFYSTVFNFYTLTNAIWMLCMYASFTNRIAYLSWFVYPVVLVYPILNMNWGTEQIDNFKYITLYSIFFTLFMQYIY